MLPFAGAAQTRGPFHLTMDTNDTIETARAFPDAVIVPVHTDGWAHFRQSADDLRASFDTLGFGSAPADSGAGCRDRHRAVHPRRDRRWLEPIQASCRPGTKPCPVRCRAGLDRTWQIRTSRVAKITAQEMPATKAGAEGASRRSRSASALPESARARPDHRRIRRRSFRDRHLQPGRRATRLRHRLDHAADLSADGGDPGNFRAGRPRHRSRHIRQCVPALSAWLLNVVVALLFIANTINIAADLGAMADATRLLIGGHAFVYVAVLWRRRRSPRRSSSTTNAMSRC